MLTASLSPTNVVVYVVHAGLDRANFRPWADVSTGQARNNVEVSTKQTSRSVGNYYRLTIIFYSFIIPSKITNINNSAVGNRFHSGSVRSVNVEASMCFGCCWANLAPRNAEFLINRAGHWIWTTPISSPRATIRYRR